MRTEPRRRRSVGEHTMALLRPGFRYSHSRDAYVLRGIGTKHGPVLRVRSAAEPAPGDIAH